MKGEEAGASWGSGPQTQGLVSRRPAQHCLPVASRPRFRLSWDRGRRPFLQAPHSWPPGARGPPASPRGARGSQQERMVTLKRGCAVPATHTSCPLSCGFGADLGKAVSPPWPRTCPGTQRWRHRRPQHPSDPGLTPRVHPGCPHTPQQREGASSAHSSLSRATYSGDDSGVRLDISSGVGTAHETGRERGDRPAPPPARPRAQGAVQSPGAETRLCLLWPPKGLAVSRRWPRPPCPAR